MRYDNGKQRKNTLYPLKRRVGELHSRSKHFTEKKNLLPQPRFEPRADRAK
jgi:hypothetical protein